jgi:hypothetical protein
MEEVAATANQLIELQDDKWRLFELNGLQRRPLLEAQRDGGVLFYQEEFGRRHGLPPDNWISGSHVHQVVVGWVPDRRCWLLGLQLKDEANPRWCELVRFPVSPRGAYSTQAQRAARALAAVLGRPLRIIHDPLLSSSPQRVPSSTPPKPTAKQQATPEVSYSLPVHLTNQALRPIPVGLRLARTGRWVSTQVLQLFLYLALIVIFGFVSGRALVTLYAPAREPWLPFAGVGVMLALGVISIRHALCLLRTADFVFDRERAALYQVSTLGRWLRSFRRQARAPMPLRTIRAVVARNLTPERKHAEWVLFVQTATNALVLAETVETPKDTEAPRAIQAAAAIAGLLNVPLRIVAQGAGDSSPLPKCDTCGARLSPGQMHRTNDGTIRCAFCGAIIKRETRGG